MLRCLQGAVHTSGSLQQLLNQTLIPITMLLSWAILGDIAYNTSSVLAPQENTTPLLSHHFNVSLLDHVIVYLIASSWRQAAGPTCIR